MSDYQNWKDNQDENWRPLHTAPSNAELREAIREILVDMRVAQVNDFDLPKSFTSDRYIEAIDQILALFQARERKLLTELLSHETASYTVDGKYNKEFVIPVSVIEQKLQQTNDGGSNGDSK